MMSIEKMNDSLVKLWQKFPILESDNLILRKMENSLDVTDLYQFWSDPIVCQYTDFICNTKDEIMHILNVLTKRFEKKQGIRWGITKKPDTTIIGTIGFNTWDKERNNKSEIGYDLHHGYWRRGIMSEALQMILKYGFTKMKLHRIEALIDPLNQNSWGLLVKNGFTFEGILRDYEFFKNKFHDCAIFSILETEKK